MVMLVEGRIVVQVLSGAVVLALGILVAVPIWALQAAVPAITKPPLVRGLPDKFDEASDAFQARIAKVFPPGSPESDMIQRLRIEGFTQPVFEESGMRRAVLQLSMPSCMMTWRVRWQARDGYLVSAVGDQGATCL